MEAVVDNEENWVIWYFLLVSSRAKIEEVLSKVRADYEKVKIEALISVKVILQVSCEAIVAMLRC